MKPSARIKEIEEHIKSMGRSDSTVALLKEKYGTANFKIVAVMQYLDEEYEQNKLCEHKNSDEINPGVSHCHDCDVIYAS